MTNKTKNVLFVVAGVIVGLLFATMFGGSNTGGVYSNVQKDFSEGISVDGTVVIDGSGNIDAPITSTTGTFSGTLTVGDDVTVTTTNTATSTIEFGCWDSYATSTDTAVRLSATSTGTAIWVYGSCSDL